MLKFSKLFSLWVIGFVLFPQILFSNHTIISAALADEQPVWESRKILSRLVNGVQRFKLSNGLRVVLFKRSHAPVFAGQIWVKVGGVDEVPGYTGGSHMLEHMAFKGSRVIGTRDFSKEQKLLDEYDLLFQELRAGLNGDPSPEKAELLKQKKLRLEKLSQDLNKLWINNEFSRIYQDRGAVGLNAATGKDYTYYKVSLPNEAFRLWAWMESDRLLNPVFRQFYKEVEVVLEERRWRTDDSPGGKLYEALLATAFWSHPNRLPIIGWPSDLRALKRKDVEQIFKTYYRPDNLVISLVGDLDVEQVKPVLELYFGRLEVPKSELPKVNTIEAKQQGKREAVVHFDAQPRFALAYHKPIFPNPDDMQFTLLHSLLAEGRSSIFYKKLVEGKELVSSIDTSEAPGELYPNLFYVWGMPKKGISNKTVIDEVESILEGLKTELVPEDDLAAAKKRLMVDLLTSMASNDGLARTLGRVELLWGDWEAVLDMYDITFATTTEQIRDLARKYFVSENQTEVRLESLEK